MSDQPTGGRSAEGSAGTRVSVIIPVFNEAATIDVLLQRLRSSPFEKQIIVVDDGSTDGTSEILQRVPDITLIRHERCRGKGAAIRTGIVHANGGIVIIQDADLEYDPAEIPHVIQPILDGRTMVSYGCRFTNGMPPGMPFANQIANQLLALSVRILYQHTLRDEATCYKAFDAALLKSIPLNCERFEFCPEVTAKVLRRGIEIVEVPLTRFRPRTNQEGKKIRWTDGFEAMWTLIRYRF